MAMNMVLLLHLSKLEQSKYINACDMHVPMQKLNVCMCEINQQVMLLSLILVEGGTANFEKNIYIYILNRWVSVAYSLKKKNINK